MKHFFVGFILIFSVCVYAQTEKSPVIIKYINAQEEFVGLNNLDKLPKSVRDYLTAIKDYMVSSKMDLNDYWVWTSYIEEDSNTISIPLCHYDGFVFKRELEEESIEVNKDRKEGEQLIVIDFNGNASGKDGNLRINKFSRKVLSYKLWE